MKKNVLLFTLVGSMVFGTAAYAADVVAVPVQAEEAGTAQAQSQEETQINYGIYTGKIASLDEGTEGYRTVLLESDDGLVLRANLSSSVVLYDAANPTEVLTVSDLAEGDEVTVLVPANAPMTLSLPPMVSEVTAVVRHSSEGNFAISTFDENLYGKEANLVLNLSEDTVICSVHNDRRLYTADDVKNSTALVFYTVTTRSLPPQTTPSMVVLLETADMASAQTTDTAQMEQAIQSRDAAEMIPLRSTVEEAGFTVEWTANDAPVTISKDGVTIVVRQGSNVVSKNGQETTLPQATTLNDGVMMVAAELEDLLS